MEEYLTKFENDDMKKAIASFSKHLKKTKEFKNEDSVLTFQDGFEHAMNIVSNSFRAFLEKYDEQT